MAPPLLQGCVARALNAHMAFMFLVIGLFSFVGGGLMMILATSYRSMDAGREDGTARADRLAAIERYLERERRLVGEFLADPSIASLYRRTSERPWIT